MRVGVLSDIHGNSVALEAVLLDLPSDISELWILGDLVGYYYDIKKVLNLLDSYKYHCVRGNHESYLKSSLCADDFGKNNKQKYGSSLEIAIKNLSSENIQFLINLPLNLVFKNRFRLSHGTPWNLEEYIYPNSTTELLDHFLKYEEEIFFIGHTHYPMKINHKGKTIINPGSVGQQRNGVLGAHWGIFDLEDETFEFKLTPYDVNEVERQVEEIDPDNSYLRLVLRRKR